MVNFNNRILLAQTQSSWGRGTSESRFEDMELGRRTRNIAESRVPPSKVPNPDSFKIEIFQGTRVCSDMQIEEYVCKLARTLAEGTLLIFVLHHWHTGKQQRVPSRFQFQLGKNLEMMLVFSDRIYNI